MPSHMNLVSSTEDMRAQVEKTLNAESTSFPPAPKRQPASQEYCDRLAAAAKERGRPLTPTEIELVGKGEPLPPVVKKDRAKTLADLEAAVRVLTERLEALEKKSVAPHMKGVERRG